MTEIKETEKSKLIDILKEINIKITNKSNSEEVSKFLEKTLEFDIESVKKLNLTGKKLFSLKNRRN